MLEMKSLRSAVEDIRMDRVRNEELRRSSVIEIELACRMHGSESAVLFGQVESTDEYHMARRVLIAEVSGLRVRDRPISGWIDDVEMALSSRGMTDEDALQ